MEFKIYCNQTGNRLLLNREKETLLHIIYTMHLRYYVVVL